jgi:hypothetical protein
VDRQPVLTFDEETHTYRVNGKVVPNVTRILKPLIGYEGVQAYILERKSAIGRAVHRATELWDADDLDEQALDPILRPYLNAYKRFIDQAKPTWKRSESRVYHARFGYAGTLDREGEVLGDPAVVDLKCTVDITPAVGVQTAAYGAPIEAEDGVKRKRYALQLRADGTYRLEPMNDASDFQTFLACLSIHNYKERYRASYPV